VHKENILIEPESLKTFLKKKQIIYESGQDASGFYYVTKGLIGLYQVTKTGKESLLRIYGPNTYFGYRTLFTQQSYPSTARAMLGSEVVKFGINSFQSLNEKSPNLAKFLMQEVCIELGKAEKRLMQFNSFNAKKRILDTLHYFFDMYPSYPWTYREISEYSGTDIATVIRYCRTLKESGVLDNSTRKPKPVTLQQLEIFKESVV
jgi:CRP-like cAMP-binding protein